jgi:hypothetical protein
MVRRPIPPRIKIETNPSQLSTWVYRVYIYTHLAIGGQIFKEPNCLRNPLEVMYVPREPCTPQKKTTCLKMSCNFFWTSVGVEKNCRWFFLVRRVFVATSVTMACPSLFFFFLVLTSLIVETLMLIHWKLVVIVILDG